MCATGVTNINFSQFLVKKINIGKVKAYVKPWKLLSSDEDPVVNRKEEFSNEPRKPKHRKSEQVKNVMSDTVDFQNEFV